MHRLYEVYLPVSTLTPYGALPPTLLAVVTLLAMLMWHWWNHCIIMFITHVHRQGKVVCPKLSSISLATQCQLEFTPEGGAIGCSCVLATSVLSHQSPNCNPPCTHPPQPLPKPSRSVHLFSGVWGARVPQLQLGWSCLWIFGVVCDPLPLGGDTCSPHKGSLLGNC